MHDCKLKNLETIGTGYSGVEALCELTNIKIENKKFIVFGYGKVGRGIVKALQKYTNNIVIVEANQSLVNKLNDAGSHAILITETNDIRKELKNTFCIMTATGIEGCISNYFDKKELDGIYLANMGVLDEFGNKFTNDDVLFSKQPINFFAKEPTLLKYLDPVLYAHNIALDLLLMQKFTKGYNQFPESLSIEIINEWAQLHNENPEEIFAL